MAGLTSRCTRPAACAASRPGGDLGDDARGARGGEAAVALELPVQVGAGHVAHDQVQPPVLLARGVHGHEVRVVDRGGQARLEREARAQAGVARPVGGDHLDRDGAAQVELRRAVHDAHAAAARDALDAAAGELGSGDQLEGGVGVGRWAAEPVILAAADRTWGDG